MFENANAIGIRNFKYNIFEHGKITPGLLFFLLQIGEDSLYLFFKKKRKWFVHYYTYYEFFRNTTPVTIQPHKPDLNASQ